MDNWLFDWDICYNVDKNEVLPMVKMMWVIQISLMQSNDLLWPTKNDHNWVWPSLADACIGQYSDTEPDNESYRKLNKSHNERIEIVFKSKNMAYFSFSKTTKCSQLLFGGQREQLFKIKMGFRY